MIIRFDEAGIKIAQYVGRSRNLNDRANGIPISQVSNNNSIEQDIQAFAAEMAFCMHYNLYPDFNTVYDGQIHDAVLPDGRTVDVKHTQYSSGRLIVEPKKIHKPCDIYYLVTGKLPEMHLRGFAPMDMVFMESNLTDFGYGETYAIDQDKLLTPDLLL